MVSCRGKTRWHSVQTTSSGPSTGAAIGGGVANAAAGGCDLVVGLPIGHALAPDQGVRLNHASAGELLELQVIDGACLFAVINVKPIHGMWVWCLMPRYSRFKGANMFPFANLTGFAQSICDSFQSHFTRSANGFRREAVGRGASDSRG